MIHRIRGIIVGALCGAAAGVAVGWLLEVRVVNRAFNGWSTVWRDCGPHVFIPLVIGAAAGIAARIDRGSMNGMLVSVAVGIACGYLSPLLYLHVFGRPFLPPRGFTAFANVFPLLLMICGGLAAAIWRLGPDRFID